MKRMLLLLFLIPVFLITQAQTNVEVNDSFFVSRGLQAVPQLQNLQYYQYDSACQASTSQFKTVDQSTGEVTNYLNELYNYNKVGNLYQYITQNWADTSYVNATRTTYMFDAKGNTISELEEIWADNSFWQPQSNVSTIYDTAENITNRITQTWDNDSMKLINSEESKFEFNSSEKDTAAISLNWDTTTQMWVPVNRTLSYYDNNEFLVKTEFQNWDVSTAVWQPQTETNYYNNTKGNADSSIKISFIDTNSVNKY